MRKRTAISRNEVIVPAFSSYCLPYRVRTFNDLEGDKKINITLLRTRSRLLPVECPWRRWAVETRHRAEFVPSLRAPGRDLQRRTHGSAVSCMTTPSFPRNKVRGRHNERKSRRLTPLFAHPSLDEFATRPNVDGWFLLLRNPSRENWVPHGACLTLHQPPPPEYPTSCFLT